MACGTCGGVKPSVQQPTIKVGFIKPNASALEVVMKATVIEKDITDEIQQKDTKHSTKP